MPEFHADNRATFPGAAGVESCSYVCSHGISPGVITLVVSLPPTDLAAFGDLTLYDGVRQITVPNCKVVNIRYSRDGSGQAWTVSLADRRWLWDAGAISGSYNERDPRDKLVPWTIKSPTELAALCLARMGETGYAVDLPPGLNGSDWNDRTDWFETGADAPPTGTNPPTVWEDEVPANALQQLCDRYGRRVVYDPVTDTVAVAPVGAGADLPDDAIESIGVNVSVPKTPAGIGVVGAVVRFQWLGRLDPVGEEWDGSYLPPAQLSYRPPPPFPGALPWDNLAFGDVRPTDRLDYFQAKARAERSVYRVFRVSNLGVGTGIGPKANSLRVAGYRGPIKRRYQLVLQQTKVEQIAPVVRDPNQVAKSGVPFLFNYYDGFSRDQPAAVLGSVVNGTVQNVWKADRDDNTPDGQPLAVGFSIDPVRQLVVFDRRVYVKVPFLVDTSKPPGLVPAYKQYVYRPASLALQTAVVVKDAVTGEPARYRRWRLVRPDGTLGPAEDNAADPARYPTGPVVWFRHDDVQMSVLPRYRFSPVPPPGYDPGSGLVRVPPDDWYGGTYTVAAVTRGSLDAADSADYARRADYYLAEHAKAFLVKGGVTNTYPGVRPVPMDGAITQTEYTTDGRGPTTVASKNCEVNPHVDPYPERRRENLKALPDAVAQNLASKPAKIDANPIAPPAPNQK